MSDEAFLQAIRDNPEDAAPLLIYADWLEERGDVRAEYLRMFQLVRSARQRMQELSRQIDPKWIATVTGGRGANPWSLRIVPESLKARFSKPTKRMNGRKLADALVMVLVVNMDSQSVKLPTDSVTVSAFSRTGQLLLLEQAQSVNGCPSYRPMDAAEVPPCSTTPLKIELTAEGSRESFAKMREDLQTFRLDIKYDSTTVGKDAVLIE